MENNNEKLVQGLIESDPLKKYGLKLVGIGAENVCLETIGSEKKFIKVSTDTLRRKIVGFVHSSEQKSQEVRFVDTYEKKKVAERKEQDHDLLEVFGSDHVLKNGYFRFGVPLTKQMIIDTLSGYENDTEIAKNLDDSKIYEIDTIVQTQPIAKELEDPESYHTLDYSTRLITHDNFMNSKSIDEALLKVKDAVESGFVDRILDLSKNPKYLEVIKNITEKIIQYTKKTGLMVDIFGPNNITMFTDKEGNIDYHLVDPILPGLKKAWTANLNDDKELKLLRHYYTYYYSIKTIAERLGIDDSLELNDLVYFEDAKIPSGSFPQPKTTSRQY